MWEVYDQGRQRRRTTETLADCEKKNRDDPEHSRDFHWTLRLEALGPVLSAHILLMLRLIRLLDRT